VNLDGSWMRNELADHLRILRAEYDLSQEEFATLLEVGLRTVTRAEEENSKLMPSRRFFQRLCQLPPDYLHADTNRFIEWGLRMQRQRRRRKP
jgi:transcriptional regulator with XRE-family HTH domain